VCIIQDPSHLTL